MIYPIVMRSLRGYLTLFSIVLLFSCGNSSKKSAEDAKNENEPKENTSAIINKTDEQVILFFGNSLTAGMGLETSEAFPALIQQRIDSLDLDYRVINAGLSGETTAGGKNRIDWVLKQEVAIFVLELGANDGLRGIPISETRQNLQAIMDKVRAKNPEVQIVLAGMQIPPNMGQDYTSEFRTIFPVLAKKNDVALIPFLLEGVAGNPALNQADGIHPTAEGYKIVRENVWRVLVNLL